MDVKIIRTAILFHGPSPQMKNVRNAARLCIRKRERSLPFTVLKRAAVIQDLLNNNLKWKSFLPFMADRL